MSSTYAAYYHHQFDYRPQFAHHPSQPIYQPPHHPIGSLDLQQSYPQDRHFHPQHHPYQARPPTSWDPPWLRQTTAYQQPSSYELDLSSPPPPSCWDPPWLRTQQEYSPPYDQPIQRQPLGPQMFDQPPAHRVSCWEPSLTATVAINQPHQHYQHSRSDLPLQQPSPAPPVTALLLASPLLPAAVVVPPLNMSALAPPCSPDISGEEGELLENLPSMISGEEVFHVANDMQLDPEFPDVIAQVNETTEWETNQHEGEERMEIQGLVDKHKEAFETTKQDMEVEIDGKRLLFNDELQLYIEVVAKGGVSLYAFIGDEGACSIRKGLKEYPFSYSDWHASDVVSMNHRSTSLDADTQLIPPRNDTLYLEYHDPKGPPLVIFDVNEEGRCSTSRCVFDPGGDGSSSKLLFTMLLVASWFPP